LEVAHASFREFECCEEKEGQNLAMILETQEPAREIELDVRLLGVSETLRTPMRLLGSFPQQGKACDS